MSSNNMKGCRLSPQQKRLYQLQQDSPVYHSQCAILIEGPLDQRLLREALRGVISRHEILRTRFVRPSGMRTALQVVGDECEPAWEYIDASEEAGQGQDGMVRRVMEGQRRDRKGGGDEEAVKAVLVREGVERHVLVMSVSGMCGDDAAVRNVVKEIGEWMARGVGGEDKEREVIQYADISEVFNELLEAQDTEAQSAKAYWRKQDFSLSHTLTVPFENKRGVTEFKPASHALRINTRLNTKLARALKDNNAAAFLLACWHSLLWRLTGQPEVVIGCVFDGRKYEELQAAMGLFARCVPVRCRFGAGYRFSEILSQVDQNMRDAYERQEYFTWDQTPDAGVTNRGLAFFPISFEMEQEASEVRAGAVSLSILEQYSCLDRFKVKLSCRLEGEEVVASFHYDGSLYEEEDMARLAEQYRMVVEGAAGDAEREAERIEIVSREEELEIVEGMNRTRKEYGRSESIQGMIEEQAENRAGEVAVVSEGEEISYGEMNERANQLARYLKGKGIGAEERVGICVERGVEMIVGVLGILKSGGAYVPLDPAMPKARLAFMLEDARARVLLTQQRLLGNLPEHGADVICIDTDWDLIAKESNANLISRATGKNMAYTLFTSGSTGRPKGVAVEHRQLANYVNAILEKIDLPPGASFATVSTIAADLGNTAIFPSLCTGGRLHIVSQERLSDPTALAQYFRQHRIDCLKIVPSHLTALLTSSRSADILPRKRLILGGEVSSWDLIDKLRQLAPDTRIINHYGPTEATVGVITYSVNENRRDISSTVPLGRPIANTQIYLLDFNLSPVPIGVAAELYIGGAGLARGYVMRPEVTAEKFIPNPFGNEPGARLYKTGDLARYLPDGNIEFLGRIDHQVKIRGFRIELGEIESVLSHNTALREAIVVAREDAPGDRRLVAYIVPASPRASLIAELRAFLKEKLPDYMVPSFFVVLEALPLTSNGKLDRNALPAPEEVRPEMEVAYVAPRSELERAIADVWKDVLHVEEVGLYDNFFDLGGHSLFMVQVHSKLLDLLGKDISMIDLFKYPTISSLAKFLSSERSRPSTHQRGHSRASTRRASMIRQKQFRQTQ